MQPTIEGKLGVPHLYDLWRRTMEKRRGIAVTETNDHRKFDRLVIDGLGLAVEETNEYLFQYAPDFAEFEDWILKLKGGSIDPLRVERVNCKIDNKPYGRELKATIAATDNAPSVLSDDDFTFWAKKGYVIVKNAISRESAGECEAAVWRGLKMSPDDPSTWYSNAESKGIMTALYHDTLLEKNRQSLRIKTAFAQLWGTGDLFVTTDRAGFNPPEKDNWKFPARPLHWDMNLMPPHIFGIQGILYLTDVSEQQGAFTCVPGFHQKLDYWLNELPQGIDPREVDLSGEAKAIAASAGDLIIWHQFLPHGASPNRTNYPRIVQYITMYPFYEQNYDNWR